MNQLHLFSYLQKYKKNVDIQSYKKAMESTFLYNVLIFNMSKNLFKMIFSNFHKLCLRKRVSDNSLL